MRKKKINIALQGGGAHGAFTWGVLDRLLEEDKLTIAGISGTSAGALNGAAFKAGILNGGNQAARDNLDWLWGEIGANDSPALPAWMTGGLTPEMASRAMEMSPVYWALDGISRLASPYTMGMAYSNPLSPIVNQFDFDSICSDKGPDLYVCATNVRSGKIRVFAHSEIDNNAILASGCLPTLFKAIEIEDKATGALEAYWDGGYMGNPALFPLFDSKLPDDIVIVNINPLYRDEIPKSPQEIQNRINEISFNGSLLRELQAITFVRTIMKDMKPQGEEPMKDVLIHMIADDHLMTQLSVATKLLANPYVMGKLKQAGQQAADGFLEKNWKSLNKQATIDLGAMFDEAATQEGADINPLQSLITRCREGIRGMF